MSDPQTGADEQPEVDAVGVDADIVTNDHHPEPDASSPSATDDGADGDDEVEVADLP